MKEFNIKQKPWFSSNFSMSTNKIWLRKTIVCLKSVLLIHEIAVGIFSPYAPLGKAKINPNLTATFCSSKLQFFEPLSCKFWFNGEIVWNKFVKSFTHLPRKILHFACASFKNDARNLCLQRTHASSSRECNDRRILRGAQTKEFKLPAKSQFIV